MLKFNMGCGHRKMAGYVNVDAFAECEPDEVVDLDQTPWPWPDSCAEELVFHHSLEHMGATSAGFLALMSELYRVAAPGCVVRIAVPHPRSDDFLNDPTHVRPITPSILQLFDKKLNDEWQSKGYSNSPLAHYLGVDLELMEAASVLAPDVTEAMQSGSLSAAQVGEMAHRQANIVREYRIQIRAHKPPRP